MDKVGWGNVCFDLIPKVWTQAQSNYLEGCGKKTTGVSWMSQLIWKLLKLQKDMWKHHNEFLHKDGRSIHDHEKKKVDDAIQREFNISREGIGGNDLARKNLG